MRCSCAASAALTTCTSDRCTRPTTRWPSGMPVTSTPGATRGSASGWSARTRSPPPAPTRRTRCSPPAATRSTAIRRSTRYPPMSPTSDSVYDGLFGGGDDHWAFGTGFSDPLAHADAPLPGGVGRAALAAYCLMLGDDALVLSNRLSEWCGRAPDLEVDIALAN